MKKTRRVFLWAALSALYLSIVFAYFGLDGFDGLFDSMNQDKTMLRIIYYFFNSHCLLSLYFLVKTKMFQVAKVLAVFLVVSVLASLFWMSGAADPGFHIHQSVFVHTIFLGAFFGVPWVPFVGTIPVLMFFVGVGGALKLVLAKNIPVSQ